MSVSDWAMELDEQEMAENGFLAIDRENCNDDYEGSFEYMYGNWQQKHDNVIKLLRNLDENREALFKELQRLIAEELPMPFFTEKQNEEISF